MKGKLSVGEFIDLVKRMRKEQRRFFSGSKRDVDQVDLCKKLEKQVDEQLSDQGRLF